jgi:hypothetical protein
MFKYKHELLTDSDKKVLDKFTTEMYNMNNFRSSYENEWKISEKQFDAELERK